MATSENKTVLEILFSENPNHIETSQYIYFVNQRVIGSQLTGSYTKQASTERYLQTDFNGTCQGIKERNIS